VASDFGETSLLSGKKNETTIVNERSWVRDQRSKIKLVICLSIFIVCIEV
jgi:hypothetical protein